MPWKESSMVDERDYRRALAVFQRASGIPGPVLCKSRGDYRKLLRQYGTARHSSRNDEAGSARAAHRAGR
jgi:hypothetical protein